MPEDARFDILVWTDTKSIQKKGTHDIKSITEKKKKTFDGYPFEGDFFTFSSADLETCGNPSGIPREPMDAGYLALSFKLLIRALLGQNC